VLDAVDLWRLWRVSLRQDVEPVGAPPQTRAALLRDMLTSVEHGLAILERQGRPLSAELAAPLTQAEVDLLPEGTPIAVTWARGGEAGTYEVHVDESGLRYVRGHAETSDASARRSLVDVGVYPLTEVLLARPCSAFCAPQAPCEALAARVVRALAAAGRERLAEAVAGETRAATSRGDVEDAVERLLTAHEIRTLLPSDLLQVLRGVGAEEGPDR
jgi:hypothetical protein